MKAMLSGRPGVAATTARLGQALDRGLIGRGLPRPGPRLAAAAAVLRAHRLPIGSALVLAVLAFVLLRIVGAAGRPQPVGPPVLASVSFQGVGYEILGISVTPRIAQRRGPAIRASGTFAIVKLRLRAGDRRRHVVASDLLALDAGETYYAASNPDDLGLGDKQWGAVMPYTVVPAQKTLNVKAIFDVPAAALRHPVSLHLGGFTPADRASARALALPVHPVCCAAAGAAAVGRAAGARPAIVMPLLPGSVLGSTPAGGDVVGPVPVVETTDLMLG